MTAERVLWPPQVTGAIPLVVRPGPQWALSAPLAVEAALQFGSSFLGFTGLLLAVPQPLVTLLQHASGFLGALHEPQPPGNDEHGDEDGREEHR